MLFQTKNYYFLILFTIFYTSQNILTSGTTRLTCIEVKKVICKHLKEGEKQTLTYRKLMKRIMFFISFRQNKEVSMEMDGKYLAYHCTSGFYFFSGDILIWILNRQKIKPIFSLEIFPKHENNVDASTNLSEFMVNDNINAVVEYVLNKLNKFNLSFQEFWNNCQRTQNSMILLFLINWIFRNEGKIFPVFFKNNWGRFFNFLFNFYLLSLLR